MARVQFKGAPTAIDLKVYLDACAARLAASLHRSGSDSLSLLLQDAALPL